MRRVLLMACVLVPLLGACVYVPPRVAVEGCYCHDVRHEQAHTCVYGCSYDSPYSGHSYTVSYWHGQPQQYRVLHGAGGPFPRWNTYGTGTTVIVPAARHSQPGVVIGPHKFRKDIKRCSP